MRKKVKGGRKPVPRSLPPLAETCAGFKGFQPGTTRLDQIFEILSLVIQRQRRSTPRSFYAMRDAAEFFGVSLRTMAKVYHRLDREGVLTLVRSSQSIIAARTPRPRFAVRGVVCMPIWLTGFLHFLDWRKWFSQLEEELSHYHFILEPIFYKAEEDSMRFVDRVLRFNPDYLLWNWPSEADLMTIQSIVDTGVPLISVQHEEHDQRFPGRTYYTSYERGLRQGVAEWTASGKIKDIVIPAGSHHLKRHLILKRVLANCSLPYRYEPCPEGESASTANILDYLRRLAPDRQTGVIFGDDLLYVNLCAVVQDEMLEFIRQHRVMVVRQTTIPTRMTNPLASMTADAVLFPWKKLARQIAVDLTNPKGTVSPKSIILEAEWLPQLPLKEVLQTSYLE